MTALESDTQIKGDHAELAVAAALKRYGWSVLMPYSEAQPYDLVAERGGDFVRVQVKSSTFDGTSIQFPCYCSNSSKSGNNRTDYTKDQIDGFAVYNGSFATDIFWVPVEQANKNTMNLNVTSETAKHPADDYLFSERFQQ
jgi:hypothetical protein